MTLPLPGDFGLTQIHGTVGKLIRFGQWLNGDGFHDYEHAFLYVGNGQLVEAEPGGARLAPLSEYADCHVRWSSGILRPTDAQRRAIVSAALGYIGVDYSFLDYFSLASTRLHVWVPGLRTYVKSTGHMICSQLVARAYFDGGYPLYDGWTGDVTPGDLYHLLEGRK